ncbi:hypothetical protein B2G71_13595 [Novosphingobium sp. PC22D]|nr:hypothetical protein B2G71_13595 [Novosphingobium sp. PC22D]
MRDALSHLRDRLDHTGLLLSGLCAVHCVLSVVIVSALGLGGQFLLDPHIHEVGLALALAIGGISLGFGVLRHGRLGPLLIGAAGLALMAAAISVPHGTGEAALTVIGVALVALAHIRNLRPQT